MSVQSRYGGVASYKRLNNTMTKLTCEHTKHTVQHASIVEIDVEVADQSDACEGGQRTKRYKIVRDDRSSFREYTKNFAGVLSDAAKSGIASDRPEIHATIICHEFWKFLFRVVLNSILRISLCSLIWKM